MDSLVKIKNKNTGYVKAFTFSLAQTILINNSRDFECADDGYKFHDKELIKQPKKKKETKPKDD